MARRHHRLADDPARHETAWLGSGHRRGHDDNAGTLYDEALGPPATTRPTQWIMRRPVDEWDDPIIDGIILKLDALAAVPATVARVQAGNYDRSVTSNALDGYEDWLTAREVADQCGVNETTVRFWRRKGIGPLCAQFGSAVRWDPKAVAEYAARLDAERGAGVRAPRPTEGTGPYVVARQLAGIDVWWTGARWDPEPGNAKNYDNGYIARRIAVALHAARIVAQSDDTDRAQTPTEDA